MLQRTENISVIPCNKYNLSCKTAILARGRCVSIEHGLDVNTLLFLTMSGGQKSLNYLLKKSTGEKV